MPPKVNFNFYDLDQDILDFLKKQGPLPFVAAGGGPDNVGEIAWDDQSGTLALKVAADVNVDIGEKLIFPVENTTQSMIAKGTPVSYAGTIGNSGKVRVRPWNGLTDEGMLFIGLAAANIPANNHGYAVHFGELHGVNTSDFSEGSILYANPQGAGLVENVASQPHVVVAVCVSSGHNGILRIRPSVVHAARWGDVLGKPNISETSDPDTLVLRDDIGGIAASYLSVENSSGFTVVAPGVVDVYDYTGDLRQGSLRPQPAGASSFVEALMPRASGTLLIGNDAAHNFFVNPTSANLALLLTDENGVGGGFVRATGATLTTPLINNPTVQGYVENTNTVAASGAAQTISIANSTFQAFTLTANCTFTLPTAVNGQSFTLIVYSNTGAFTTNFVAPAGSSISWANQIVPLGTNIANRADLYSFVAHGTRWFASQSPNHSA